MGEAIAIIEAHLARARADAVWHLATRKRRDNIDAAVAGLKASWLKALLRDMRALAEAGRERGDG